MAKKREEKFNYNESIRVLRDNGPQRLYFIWGAEDYLSGLYFDELKKLCVGEGDDDFSFRRLTERDFTPEALAEAIDSVPFLSERTLVEVRNVELNKLAGADRVLESLKDIPDYCTVAFINDSTFEPDKRLKFFKTAMKNAVEIHTTAQGGASLINWIIKRFAVLGKEIELPAAQRLISVSGELMNGLIPEINKVAGYSKGKKVTVEDVDAVAHHIPEAVVFEMADCISRGETDTAAELLSELLADRNNEPIAILAILGMQMRRLYAAKIAAENGLGREYVMKLCGLKFDFAASKLIAAARRFDTEQLRRGVELCTEADYAMKSSRTEPADILKECVMRICIGEAYV